jgi:hypothetical protein
MPLHDWTERPGWDGVHHIWITELLRWVKPQLPTGYRAYIGTAPTVAIGAPLEKPDLGVRKWQEQTAPESANGTPPAGSTSAEQPDEEVAVSTLDPGTSLFVELHGRLIAAVELISPRNKDRVAARTTYLNRYLGYLLEGVHLLLVDVHRRPLGFSLAEQIAAELKLTSPPCPPPLAVSYRVGEPAPTGGRFLAVWRRQLTIGQPLPKLPLAITLSQQVSIDLEQTYLRAAADAYLE